MLLIQSLWVECKVCLSHAGGLRWQNLFLVTLQSAGISLAGNLHNISLNEELNDCFPSLQNEKDKLKTTLMIQTVRFVLCGPEMIYDNFSYGFLLNRFATLRYITTSNQFYLTHKRTTEKEVTNKLRIKNPFIRVSFTFVGFRNNRFPP